MHLVPITLRECLTLQVVSNVSPSAVLTSSIANGALLVPLHRRLSAPSSRDALASAPVPTWIALGKLNLAQSSASLSGIVCENIVSQEENGEMSQRHKHPHLVSE